VDYIAGLEMPLEEPGRYQLIKELAPVRDRRL
jgi:hypothetical protein